VRRSKRERRRRRRAYQSGIAATRLPRNAARLFISKQWKYELAYQQRHVIWRNNAPSAHSVTGERANISGERHGGLIGMNRVFGAARASIKQRQAIWWAENSVKNKSAIAQQHGIAWR